MFSHRSRRENSRFLSFRTSNNASLTVTPGHYLYVGAKHSKGIAQVIRAADVTVGDYLWTLRDSQGSHLMPARVIDIKGSVQMGLYNPHTVSGTILVDQIAATTFTDTIAPSLMAHRLMTYPAFLVYMMVPHQMAECLNNALLLLYSHAQPLILALCGAVSQAKLID